ncbi:SH2 domain-containing protein 7 [Mugil cephalus]|uniref:SH2 domain-containing protein 7 n=1 Tax=Mugil cephalus TaxID=48193 RepID=UPI001FB85EA4|nr:SH2 domain-containing protein 7 [Mugil cephalus]
MERRSAEELLPDAAEGGLKELVLRWFTETQAPVILHNGNFPDWFQGLAARKDAEDLLRDKPLGCFLIRLSDKTIGYILSYKGHDRCRHFVINQDQDGHFVIAGDCQKYGSLPELIEHYKVSPIQPFGEYLSSSCYQVETDELYDVVSYKYKRDSGVSVQALRALWDQKNSPQVHPGNNERTQQNKDPSKAHPPTLPPKSNNRKLTGTVSVDAVSLSQALPPVPKRGMPPAFALSGSLPDTTSHPDETDSTRAEGLTGSTASGDLSPSGVMYSEVPHVESRSRSLPQLDNSNMEEDEYSNQTSSLPFTPTAPTKKVTCHTYSLHAPGEDVRSKSEPPGDDPDTLKSNPLYHSSERPEGGSAQRGEEMYAEVPGVLSPTGPADNTYEQIPGEPGPGNTYESLEDMKVKKNKHTWGKNNIKWMKFLPEYKKK